MNEPITIVQLQIDLTQDNDNEIRHHKTRTHVMTVVFSNNMFWSIVPFDWMIRNHNASCQWHISPQVSMTKFNHPEHVGPKCPSSTQHYVGLWQFVAMPWVPVGWTLRECQCQWLDPVPWRWLQMQKQCKTNEDWFDLFVDQFKIVSVCAVIGFEVLDLTLLKAVPA